MLDPRREGVLVRRDQYDQVPVDKTADVDWYSIEPRGTVNVRFMSRQEPYPYNRIRVLLLSDPRPVALPEDARLEVDGKTWSNVTEILAFWDGERGWTRYFYPGKDGSTPFRTVPSSRARIVKDAGRLPAVRGVLDYLRAVVSTLPADDPLHAVYGALKFVHPDSALARYLTASPIAPRETIPPMLFPFQRNASQWQAVENALRYPLSVIDGPPGTGKTETILNFVASVIATGTQTVGVVSFQNAAVQNVASKLTKEKGGCAVALLGKKEKREAFFATQNIRNAAVQAMLSEAKPVPLSQAIERLASLDERLRQLYGQDRRRAELQSLLVAFELERDHFARCLERHEVPAPRDLPLLRRSPERILQFLAETQLESDVTRPGLIRRIRRYFRYGSLQGMDPQNTEVVLRVQEAFYLQRIAELRDELAQLDRDLTGADYPRLATEHQQLSIDVLRTRLIQRYQAQAPGTYAGDTYRDRDFEQFIHDYPVLLSTCHSLPASIARGHLLDYVVIDEASQLDILGAVPALASCRNAIIVGDLKQLEPIDTGSGAELVPPAPPYDCRRHSILSSVIELYGEGLPRTLLREHYRCDPAIIGFCNRMFYDDQLVAFTSPRIDEPMVVVRTAPGSHGRRHRDGGRSNQRELEVIAMEVAQKYLDGIADDDVGITSPYRQQVRKAEDILDRHEADTVHRFQGRQKRVVILSTVIDDTRSGRSGLKFVDDPRLVNVAVSRATDRFILVTDSSLLPSSRYLRSLIGYTQYQDPDRPIAESAVVSVFDLLYQEFSEVLRPLASRLETTTAYPSENIIGTVLTDIVATEQFSHLRIGRQVLLQHLLPTLSGLTERQAAYVRHRASVDFVVYNRVTNDPVLAVEVDGFSFHENNPEQLVRDGMKNAILELFGLPLLRLATTGSGEEDRIRGALTDAENRRARETVRPAST